MEVSRERADTIRPEIQLLLHCARARVDADRLKRIQALTDKELDWNYLDRVAAQHGLRPLLFWNLRQLAINGTIKINLSRFENHFYENTSRNLYMADQLIGLLKVFHTNGIQAIPYKGPVLAASVYGNLSLREFGDLDIFIPVADLPRVTDLLLGNGYRKVDLNPVPQEAYNCQFVNQEARVFLEIHWAFTWKHMSFPMDYDRLLSRIRSTTLADAAVPTFSPEDLLLILSVHANKHRWARIIWIADVAEIVSRGELDWSWTIAQARKMTILRILLIGLHLSRELLGIRIPDEIRPVQERDRAAKSLAAIPARWITLEENPRWGEGPIFFARSRERFADQLRCFLYYLRSAARPAERKKSKVVRPQNSLRYLYDAIRFIRRIRATIK